MCALLLAALLAVQPPDSPTSELEITTEISDVGGEPVFDIEANIKLANRSFSARLIETHTIEFAAGLTFEEFDLMFVPGFDLKTRMASFTTEAAVRPFPWGEISATFKLDQALKPEFGVKLTLKWTW